MKPTSTQHLQFTDTANHPIVTLTTDGGCEPNPGFGRWAAILRMGTHSRESKSELDRIKGWLGFALIVDDQREADEPPNG